MNTIDRYLPPNQPDSRPGYAKNPVLNEVHGETAGFKIGLADLRAMAWRQRYMIAIITGAALLAGLIVTLLTTPIYRATATVQINQDKSNILAAGQDVTPEASLSDSGRYLKTQEQILESRTMAIRVVRALRLGDNDQFIVAMGGKPIANTVPANNREQVRNDVAVGLLLANVDAVVPIDSRIAGVNFQSPDPNVAARLANAFAKTYVEENIASAFRSTDYARSFLLKQVNEARNRLAAAERRSINYASSTRLIDASDAAASTQADGPAAAGRSLSTASLVRLNEQLGEARAERISAESRWNSAQRMPLLQVPEVLTNPIVSGLLSERATAQAQLAQLSERYRPGNPQVEQIQAQISAIDRQIARNATTARDSLRNAAVVAQQRERVLNTAIDQFKGTVLTEQQRRVELNGLAQDVDISRSTLRDLLQRYNQVSAASGIIANNLAIVDSAIVPISPYRPRPMFNLAIALAAGVALSLIAAILREALNDTVRSPDDIETKLNLPMLGTTPKITIDPTARNDVLSDPNSALSEAYFSIRAALDFSTPHGAPRSLIVTSSAPSEGKSTTAYALALDYARIGIKTLLVDCDLRRPSIHGFLGKRRNLGFVEVLAGHAPFDEVVQSPPGSNLHILPLGKVAANPVQLLSSDAITRFLAKYSQEYDLIILDTAPVMGIADTPLIARTVEGIVMVVEAGRAHRGQAKTAIKRLRETGGNILGVVLSKFDGRDAGYGYDYYHYAYSYRRETEAQTSEHV